jgi:hypothetical protein
MSNLNCEYVRDVYPEVLNGSAQPVIVQSVRAHIASCDDCRAEIAIIEAIHARPMRVPDGLHDRVMQSASQRPSRWQFSRNDMLMAATLAAALIGGSVLMRRPEPRPTTVATPAADETATRSLGAVNVEDAMLSGKASLDDLSVEQLEKLLQEVES